MVNISCAIVGVENSSFDVNFDENASVYALKREICDRNDYKFPAVELKLFPAKTGGSAWLSTYSKDMAELEKGKKTPLIEALTEKGKELVGANPLVDMLKEMDPPVLRQIHVLVVLPVGKKRKRGETTSLSDLLDTCSKNGFLPTEGDFLQMFEWNDQDCGKVKDIKAIGDIVGFTGSKFFVRKEVLCVLENLQHFKTNFDNGDVKKQFIFMGSPGTGKSCVLALLCFYVAATSDHPVLWYRTVLCGREESFTCLLYQKKYYLWEGAEVKIYDQLFDEVKKLSSNGLFWPCVDGVNQKSIFSTNSRHLRDHTILSTSGQFDPHSEGSLYVTLCLMPYWKRHDLKLLALAFGYPEKEVIADQYFVSGGSLREFLNPNSRLSVQSALNRIKTPEHGRNLHTSVGCGGDEQIDRLRMRGVKAVANPKAYVDQGEWDAAVTSPHVLQYLASLMQPVFFKELAEIAKGLADDRLEGVALENYFHAQVRNKRTIVMNYRTYDNVSRGNGMKERVWRALMEADTGTITCAPTSNVKWSGVDIKQCVREMKDWANDLSSIDYWIPRNTLCETIDAVAKCQFKNEEENQICFLQLTKAKKHKCDAEILWMLAQPFVGKAKVCYIVLHSSQNEDISLMDTFRLSPVVISKPDVKQHIPLYVATYRLEQTSS